MDYLSVALMHEVLGQYKLNWDANHPAFNLHMVSVISEWISFISTMGYILTFRHEFARIKLVEVLEIEVKCNINKNHSSDNVL